MPPAPDPKPSRALGLLLVINLFCYLDRSVLLAIIPSIKAEFLAGDANANGKAGLLTTAFLFSYMLTAPLFGWLADRFSRWIIIGCSVALWSLACGASGLAGSFVGLLVTRAFLGLGEAGYGPAAPTIISDLYPVERRGAVLAWFYMAIPVGSALGYVIGGQMDFHFGWRSAFYAVAPPGLLLAVLCWCMPEPKRAAAHAKPSMADYRALFRIPSLITNILAQAALTFAIGGLAAWAPTYLIEERHIASDTANSWFGIILVVTGALATLLGGWLADRLRARYSGAYFLVSGIGMLLAFPFAIGMLYLPFPLAWVSIALAMFFLFLNVGPSNTAIANVTPPAMRATAFALNILVIHALGDAFSPALIGFIKDHGTWNMSFFTVSLVMLVAGIIWLCSLESLARDTAAVEKTESAARAIS